MVAPNVTPPARSVDLREQAEACGGSARDSQSTEFVPELAYKCAAIKGDTIETRRPKVLAVPTADPLTAVGKTSGA